MASLAAFVQSDGGRFYSLVCERYGIDPATGLADDVVAHNLRAGLALASMRATEDDVEPGFEEKYG